MFNSKQNQNLNQNNNINNNNNMFSENRTSNEPSRTFLNPSQNSTSNDFSASFAQMDKIIHQRMQNDYLGICENMKKMNLDEKYKGLGTSFSGDLEKNDDELYSHVVGLRDGFFQKGTLGSDFSHQNSNLSCFRESCSKNSIGSFSMTRPFLDHEMNFSENNSGSLNLGRPFLDHEMNFSENNSGSLNLGRPFLDHEMNLSQNNSGMNNLLYPSLSSNMESSSRDVSMLYGNRESMLYPKERLLCSNRGENVEFPMCDDDLMFYRNPGWRVEKSESNDLGNRSLNVENPMSSNDLMFYRNRGDSSFQNPVFNNILFCHNQSSSFENPVCNETMFCPDQTSSFQNPVRNGMIFCPNRDSSFQNPVRNGMMFCTDQSSSFENPVRNGMMFCPDQSSSFENPVCNNMMLNPNRAMDLSVENMLCNDMVLRDGIRLTPYGRGPNSIGDLEPFGCEDSFILEGRNLESVEGNGKSTCAKLPRSRRKKSHAEKKSRNRIGEKNVNPNSEDLMNNSVMSSSLYEFRGYVYFITKDQFGCRFLQSVVAKGNYLDIQILFNETIDHVGELMRDPFANYVINKMVEVCNEEQLTHIVCMLTARQGELVDICLNIHGTRVVQKLIESLKTRHQKVLVASALQARFLDLVADSNGYHVIRTCLHSLNKEDTKFIFDIAAKCCFCMATHQFGCCILKSCITYSDGRYQEKLVTEIVRHGLFLAQDAFGNYVIQQIIELKIPSAAAILNSQFRGNYVFLSVQKFSSHVVQNFLNNYDKCRPIIVKEFLSVPHFEQLLQDPFANYVIQTAIDVSTGPLHVSLVQAVQSHSTLRSSPYYKKFFSGNLLKK